MKKTILELGSLFLLAVLSLAQSAAAPPAPLPTATQQPAGENANAAQAPTQPSDEVKITPRQAEELFHSVDDILTFDSRESGLPIKKQIKRKLTSREEVVKYLTQHMNDDDTKRLQRSELVLKKFGLLPREFDLQKLMVAMLREEVAGFYDPKTKTVNMLDWVPIEEQEPVMAHELTHALQDQSIGLEKWMKKGDKDLGEIKHNPTPADIDNDEIGTVREAVVEGQAQAIMFQYAIAPAGRSIVSSPELLDSMETTSMTGTPSTEVFNSAPIFLKESMTFPYSYGMEFVVKLMRKGGKEKAFAEVLRHPPHTTREIMQPETYLAGEKIPLMRIPDLERDFKSYQKVDIGGMGEFDVAVLVEQYAGKEESKQLYPEWRGGYYYAARPKDSPTAPLGLLYVSRWSSPEKAEEFAAIYAKSLAIRYKKTEKAASPSDDRTDSSKASEPSTEVKGPRSQHAWTTEEGAVLIDQEGDTVLISESLDPTTTQLLQKEVFGK